MELLDAELMLRGSIEKLHIFGIIKLFKHIFCLDFVSDQARIQHIHGAYGVRLEEQVHLMLQFLKDHLFILLHFLKDLTFSRLIGLKLSSKHLNSC